MRRPPLPTGEVAPTRRLSPVTHPTQVIRRLEDQAAASPAFLRLLERLSVILLVVAPFVIGLALTAPSVPVLILGFAFMSGGFAAYSFAELLRPEVAGWDVRLLERVKGWRKR